MGTADTVFLIAADMIAHGVPTSDSSVVNCGMAVSGLAVVLSFLALCLCVILVILLFVKRKPKSQSNLK